MVARPQIKSESLTERVKAALREADQLQFAAIGAITDTAQTTEAWSLVVKFLVEEVEGLRRRIDHLEADTPHVEPPRPRQVLEGWAERGFVPDADGRLREIADDRLGPTLR